MMQIVLLGAPGCGKGTQSELLSKKYSIPSISTGNLLRAATQQDDEMALQIKNTINNGKLVGNDLIVKILKNRLALDDCKKGFLLDGFPRSVEQAKLNSELMTLNNKFIVIEIKIEEDILFKRLSGRFTCKNCNKSYNKFFLLPKQSGICDSCHMNEFSYRSDDETSVIKKRIEVYAKETMPLIEYYSKSSSEGKLSWHFQRFDGNTSVDILFEKISSYLREILTRL